MGVKSSKLRSGLPDEEALPDDPDAEFAACGGGGGGGDEPLADSSVLHGPPPPELEPVPVVGAAALPPVPLEL